MFRKISFFAAFVLLILVLSSCRPSTSVSPSPTPPLATPAVPPASPVPQASPTTGQPTAEPTMIEPSPTVPVEPSPTSLPPGDVIAHFPAGQEIALTFINMIDKDLGWGIGGLVGVGDHVLVTKDGGSTWADVTPPEPVAPEGKRKSAIGYFPDTSTAWVTYYGLENLMLAEPVVWRTQDGGQTWQASQPLDVSGLEETYQPSHLIFSGQDTGWLLVHVGVGMNHDYVVLYKTEDSGQTWSRLIDPYGDSGIQSCAKTGLIFPDTQNGWLTGDCGGVAAGALLFHSGDGGLTWQSVTLPSPAVTPDLLDNPSAACGTYSPVFFDAQNGKLVVQCTNYTQDPPTKASYLYSTTDGGATWTSGPYPGGTLLMIDANTGWALEQEIFQTLDGGATWTDLGSVTWQGQFDFVDAQTGWAVARSGDQLALVNTTDGGATWAELHPKIGG